jgi:hypothetical protein
VRERFRRRGRAAPGARLVSKKASVAIKLAAALPREAGREAHGALRGFGGGVVFGLQRAVRRAVCCVVFAHNDRLRSSF